MDFLAKYAVCPFYHKVEGKRICCEGVGEESSINLAFKNLRDLRIYFDKYCVSLEHYRQCRVCRMLNEKWCENEQIR